MNGLRSFFATVWGKTAQSDFQKSWDFERARASKFGPSHVSEIDAIFAQHANTR